MTLRVAAILVLAIALMVPAGGSEPVARTANEETTPAITPTADGTGLAVSTPSYSAVVDSRHGNLARLATSRGDVLLGGGRIDGLVVAWNGASSEPGGSEADVQVVGDTVVVRHEAYDLVYAFGPDAVTVTVTPTAAANLLMPLTVRAASIEEPSREAALRFSAPAYVELAGYPTDYWTDSSAGQFSLWTTAVYTVGGHTYRGAMLKPTLDGLCRWETTKGQVTFDHAEGHDAGPLSGSLLYRETCGLDNSTDIEVAGTVVLPALHQVVQTFDSLAAGSVLSFTVAVNDRGYDVTEQLYPVSTRHLSGANTGFTSAKIVRPWHVAEGGYPMVVYMPGHWDELYTHSYLWDYLANHGYLVVVPFTTADMGDGHQRDDWGYMSQIEADELRMWAMDEFDVDADRVYTAGLSLGGLNTLLNAVNHPDAYAATIYYSGVYDFVRFWATPLGASSFPLNVEAPLCCGDPVNNPYEYSIRSPRDRIAQFQGGLFITQGDADAVAPADHAIELSTAVPGSILNIGQGAHENNVFAGFRKEALEFIKAQPPRPAAQRDQVDLLVYGHPDFTPVGFVPFEERRNYTTEWMTVWVEDAAFTRVQAEVIPTGYRIEVDRPATVELQRPAWCIPGCDINAADSAGTGAEWTATDRRSVRFELAADTPATVAFNAFEPPATPPPPEKDSPGVGLAVALSALALLALARRRRA